MVGPACGLRVDVGRHVDTRKRAELIGEMGLVVEAAFQRQGREGNGYLRAKTANGALEALHAAPDLGSEPNLRSLQPVA